MRRPFIDTLSALADADPRIVLLTGDLGFTVVERFAERHGDRFVNAGVAEQNMIGLATGLAEAGMLPFVYSITPFATLRGYEQLRNGPSHQGLPVRIVGIGGGFDYGTAGYSHHALEDLAVMRSLPGFSTVVPPDDDAACADLRRTWDAPHPIYYRLAKDAAPRLPALEGCDESGATLRVAHGDRVSLVTLGSATRIAFQAREQLLRHGVRAGLVVVRSLVRGEAPGLAKALEDDALVVSVEDHGEIGGLGTVVAEMLAEHGGGARLLRIGVPPVALPHGLGRDQLNAAVGLTPGAICRRVLEAWPPRDGDARSSG